MRKKAISLILLLLKDLNAAYAYDSCAVELTVQTLNYTIIPVEVRFK